MTDIAILEERLKRLFWELNSDELDKLLGLMACNFVQKDLSVMAKICYEADEVLDLFENLFDPMGPIEKVEDKFRYAISGTTIFYEILPGAQGVKIENVQRQIFINALVNGYIGILSDLARIKKEMGKFETAYTEADINAISKALDQLVKTYHEQLPTLEKIVHDFREELKIGNIFRPLPQGYDTRAVRVASHVPNRAATYRRNQDKHKFFITNPEGVEIKYCNGFKELEQKHPAKDQIFIFIQDDKIFVRYLKNDNGVTKQLTRTPNLLDLRSNDCFSYLESSMILQEINAQHHLEFELKYELNGFGERVKETIETDGSFYNVGGNATRLDKVIQIKFTTRSSKKNNRYVLETKDKLLDHKNKAVRYLVENLSLEKLICLHVDNDQLKAQYPCLVVAFTPANVEHNKNPNFFPKGYDEFVTHLMIATINFRLKKMNLYPLIDRRQSFGFLTPTLTSVKTGVRLSLGLTPNGEWLKCVKAGVKQTDEILQAFSFKKKRDELLDNKFRGGELCGDGHKYIRTFLEAHNQYNKITKEELNSFLETIKFELRNERESILRHKNENQKIENKQHAEALLMLQYGVINKYYLYDNKENKILMHVRDKEPTSSPLPEENAEAFFQSIEDETRQKGEIIFRRGKKGDEKDKKTRGFVKAGLIAKYYLFEDGKIILVEKDDYPNEKVVINLNNLEAVKKVKHFLFTHFSSTDGKFLIKRQEAWFIEALKATTVTLPKVPVDKEYRALYGHVMAIYKKILGKPYDEQDRQEVDLEKYTRELITTQKEVIQFLLKRQPMILEETSEDEADEEDARKNYYLPAGMAALYAPLVAARNLADIKGYPCPYACDCYAYFEIVLSWNGTLNSDYMVRADLLARKIEHKIFKKLQSIYGVDDHISIFFEHFICFASTMKREDTPLTEETFLTGAEQYISDNGINFPEYQKACEYMFNAFPPYYNKVGIEELSKPIVHYLDNNACVNKYGVKPVAAIDMLGRLCEKAPYPKILVLDITSSTQSQVLVFLKAFDQQDKIPILVTASSMVKHSELGLDLWQGGENKAYLSKKAKSPENDQLYIAFTKELKKITTGSESGLGRCSRRLVREAITEMACRDRIQATNIIGDPENIIDAIIEVPKPEPGHSPLTDNPQYGITTFAHKTQTIPQNNELSYSGNKIK